MEHKNDADMRFYTDGSGHNGQVGAAAVLYRGFRPPKVLQYHLGSEEDHTVPEEECMGQISGMELLKKEVGVRMVTFRIDN